MDKPKANKRKVVKKAIKLDSIKVYLDMYKKEIKEINMSKKYTNKKLKKQLNSRARELRTRIKLLKEIEGTFNGNILHEIKGYYEKYGYEGVIAVLERNSVFPKYNFLTMNSILDLVDWSLNNKF